jgi:hypothetical protein
LADLPPLPPDVVSFWAASLDAAGLYDTGVQLAENLAGLGGGDGAAQVKESLRLLDDSLGVKLRDVLATLGDRVVLYNTPGEGSVIANYALLWRVKDARQLDDAIGFFVRTLAGSLPEVSITRRNFQGAELYQFKVRQPGGFFPFIPTLAIHKDWLAVSFFPQPVKGHVLRANGALPGWQPCAHVKAALEKLPREYYGLAVTDPRPAVKQLLNAAPLFSVFAELIGRGGEPPFDPAGLPNAQSATHHLFPNVSVLTSDDRGIRLEDRTSLALPLNAGGLDTLGSIFVLQLLYAF